jgi:hypothetical protein
VNSGSRQTAKTRALHMMSGETGATHGLLLAHGISQIILDKLVADGLAQTETGVLARPRGVRITRYRLTERGRQLLLNGRPPFPATWTRE